MGFVVVITWFAAVLMGLFMLAVWLIENDVTDRNVTPSRLPVLVVFAHMTLAAAGLGIWVAYLIVDRTVLAWVAIGTLGGIALLGATMFLRWIPVYRHAAQPVSAGQLPAGMPTVPAERNFRSPSSPCMGCSPSPPWSWRCSSPWGWPHPDSLTQRHHRDDIRAIAGALAAQGSTSW